MSSSEDDTFKTLCKWTFEQLEEAIKGASIAEEMKIIKAAGWTEEEWFFAHEAAVSAHLKRMREEFESFTATCTFDQLKKRLQGTHKQHEIEYMWKCIRFKRHAQKR